MPPHRKSIVQAASERHDVIIIGGGINGAGIARDAALRGYQVALFEKSDFASGTSSRSSKLIHGGIRYLEQGRLGLVFEAIREREILHRIAPHLTRPLPFIFPIYRDSRWGKTLIHLGVILYNLLAMPWKIHPHRILSRDETLRMVPDLKPDGLNGAAFYYDGQMDDARLALANILEARLLGAGVWNYASVTGFLKGNSGKIRGVDVRDRLTGEEATFRAPVVVNAAGPWVDEVCDMDDPGKNPKTRGTRGSHIVLPKLMDENALVIRSGRDNRILFVIPWEGMTLVGTTDVDDSSDPGKIRCPEEDRDYLLGEARRFFPGKNISTDDVIASFAGVRPLVYSPDGHASLVSRESKIFESRSGLISISGGKYTTYRQIAEDVVDRFRKKLPNTRTSPCVTRSRPLFGGELKNTESYLMEVSPKIQERFSLDNHQIRHLITAYGTKHSAVLSLASETPSLAERLHPGLPNIRAEVVYAVREEAALHLSDFLRRRSLIALGPHGRTMELMEEAARLMGEELGWGKEEETFEINAYLEETKP